MPEARSTWFPVSVPATRTRSNTPPARVAMQIADPVPEEPEPDSLRYPSHIIVPDDAVGVSVGGTSLPFELVSVGLGLAHLPFAYTGDLDAELVGAPGAAAQFDITLGSNTVSWGDKDVTVGAFLNGTTLTPASEVSVEDGTLRKCRKINGTYTNGRWRTYYQTVAGTNGVRITHNMRIPTTNPPSNNAANFTTDLGFELGGMGDALTSSLGDELSGYNADIDGQWTGWVAGNGVFVSVRGVALCWPRGFSLDPETGKLRLYIHFENGARVRAGDYDYDTIAHLNYLHQGKLNLYMPQEYRDAIKTGVGSDAQLVEEMNEIDIDSNRAYPCHHAGQTLEILVAFYDEANGIPDFEAWHDVHEAGPIASLAEVEGMKGDDFPDVEDVIRRDILSYAQEYHGQWLDGDFRENPDTLHRCRTPNHYRWCSYVMKEFLRTRDQAILQQARRLIRYYRDMAVYDPAGTDGITTHTGFSHGKSLLPWQEISSQGHWVDPTSLLYAWQVDGDRVSKDKYDLWNPSVWTTGANREVKNTLVHARIKKDYLGQNYTTLEGMRASVESKTLTTYIAESSAGVWWHPDWETEAYGAANPIPRRNYENIWSLIPSIHSGEISQHYGWLSRLQYDRPEPVLPGPIGDGWLQEQWPKFLDELRNQDVTEFEFLPEMGNYPQKLCDWRTIATYGSVVVFTKDANPLTIRFGARAMAGDADIQSTLIRVQRPDGTWYVLQQTFPMYYGGAWDEPAYERPSGRGGQSHDYTIIGPAGEYKLLVNSYEGEFYGPYTAGPEYSVVLPGARSGFVEGWFRPTNGSPVFVRNLTPPYVVEDAMGQTDVYSWPTGGTFAQELEWLPANTPAITTPTVSSRHTSLGMYWSTNASDLNDELSIAQFGTGAATYFTKVGSPVRTVGAGPFGHNNAVRFTRGAGTRYTLPDSSNLPKGDVDFTVALWIKPEDLTNNFNHAFITKGPSTLIEWFMDIAVSAGVAKVRGVVYDGLGGIGVVTSTAALTLNTWSHLIFWHDKTLNTINLTIDGGATDSVAWTTGTRAGTGSLCLGHWSNAVANQSFGGYLSEVGIWKKVLSPTERTAQRYDTYPF